MKKIVSLSLAAIMLLSMVPTAFAADYTAGTKVEYTAADQTAYTITVPAQLAPGASGEVKLEGTWASDTTVKVTADASVTLTNSINAEDKHTLDITFPGIEKAGDNTQSRTYTENVTVAEMPENALFGTWSGKFNYNVEFDDGIVDTVVFYDVAYDLAPGESSNAQQMKIGSDGVVYVKLSNTTPPDADCSRQFGYYTANGQTLTWSNNTILISEDGYTLTVQYSNGTVTTYQYTP